MTRRFGALDMVQLPVLDSLSAQTLGVKMLAVASGRKLSTPVAEALADLAAAHDALESAATNRLPDTVTPDPVVSKAADVELDASWSALYDFLSGWSKLPNHPHAEVAASLFSQLFPDGLKFIQQAYKLEFAESRMRLRMIKDRDFATSIGMLGGAAIVAQLHAAHDAYGKALGVTTAEDEAAAVSVRDALDDFGDSLRHYIVRVAASVRRQDPATAVEAHELLAPVETWQPPGASTKPAEPTPAADGADASPVATPAKPPALPALPPVS